VANVFENYNPIIKSWKWKVVFMMKDKTNWE